MCCARACMLHRQIRSRPNRGEGSPAVMYVCTRVATPQEGTASCAVGRRIEGGMHSHEGRVDLGREISVQSEDCRCCCNPSFVENAT